MDRTEATALFEKYVKKLRITPAWDVKLEFGDNKNLSYGRCGRGKSFIPMCMRC